jgi:hypothetical protein|tara:strand:- start:5629 stop:5802 length:174 start_codon:yes stop_codon:yes gene_type:complete
MSNGIFKILNKWFHKIGRLLMPTLYDLNPKLRPKAKKKVEPTVAVKKKGRPKKTAKK